MLKSLTWFNSRLTENKDVFILSALIPQTFYVTCLVAFSATCRYKHLHLAETFQLMEWVQLADESKNNKMTENKAL